MSGSKEYCLLYFTGPYTVVYNTHTQTHTDIFVFESNEHSLNKRDTVFSVYVRNESWERQQRRMSVNRHIHVATGVFRCCFVLMYTFDASHVSIFIENRFCAQMYEIKNSTNTRHINVCTCIAHNDSTYLYRMQRRQFYYMYWNVSLKKKICSPLFAFFHFFYCFFWKSWHTNCLMVMGIVMKLYQKFSELTSSSLKTIVISMSLSQHTTDQKINKRNDQNLTTFHIRQ